MIGDVAEIVPKGAGMADPQSPTTFGDLIRERRFSAQQIWDAAEARLDRPISEGLNTAHEVCDRWARDRARIALIVRDADGTSTRWTYAELSRASSRLATAWRSDGVQRGDRVCAILPQQIEAYIAALAAWRAGVIYVPLFVGFGPEALSQRISASEPALVVVDHRYRDNLTAAHQHLDGDPVVYTVGADHGAAPRSHDRDFWNAIDAHPAECSAVATASAEPATIIFTSGTTGAPKACVQPHSLLLTIHPFLRHVLALGPGDMLFSGANPGWSYGLYGVGVGPMSLGFPHVVYSGDFDPKQWLRIFEEEQITYVAAAPSAFRRLTTEAEELGLPASIRGATCAGEPLDAALAQAWKALSGNDLQDVYGQSECGLLLGCLDGDDTPPAAGALSSTIPGFEVDLVDEHGTVQVDEGIIALRRTRYQASIGYRNADEQWAARWRGEYFLTGDLARRDAQGRMWFTGRADDLIVTSGYNVGPTEIENIILAHPGVEDAAVVGAADPKRGTVVRAVVVLSGRTPAQQVSDDIKQEVKTKIGRHAYPRIIDFVDQLPRTETGKIRRGALRAQTGP
jgi:acetyl-CoA synthetase